MHCPPKISLNNFMFYIFFIIYLFLKRCMQIVCAPPTGINKQELARNTSIYPFVCLLWHLFSIFPVRLAKPGPDKLLLPATGCLPIVISFWNLNSTPLGQIKIGQNWTKQDGYDLGFQIFPSFDFFCSQSDLKIKSWNRFSQWYKHREP